MTTPEVGIENYKFDQTQGPDCAMAYAAGTAYRNYLVSVPFANSNSENQQHRQHTKEEEQLSQCQRGQTRDAQLNGLHAIESYLISSAHLVEIPWTVQNGYIESTRPKLEALNKLLHKMPQIREEIISRLCIGVQEDTTATDPLVRHGKYILVTQTYNSAISIGYSTIPENLWEPIARIVLEATYEATLLVGLLKTIKAAMKNNKSKKPVILLTKVGGGVFKTNKVG